jgi:lipopolysaccharide/colanic/teichoic acid biosynthesis glycosyltransferase
MDIPSPNSPASFYTRRKRLAIAALLFAELPCAALAPFLALLMTNGDPAAPGSLSFVLIGAGIASLFVWSRDPAEFWFWWTSLPMSLLISAASTAALTYAALVTFGEPVPEYGAFVTQALLLFALWSALRVARSAADEGPRPEYREHVLVVGATRPGLSLAQFVERGSGQSVKVAGLLDDRAVALGRNVAGLPILGTTRELPRILAKLKVHGVEISRILCPSIESPGAWSDLASACSAEKIQLVPFPIQAPMTFSGSPAADENPTHLWKRCADVALAGMALVLLAPLMLTISVIVWVDLGSPILFWQERLGLNRKRFTVLKFRTLRYPYDAAGRPLRPQERLSKFGTLLRNMHLDELPQLLNVLAGDMSLVGPRPLMADCQPAEAGLRFAVRPGITGLAQVKGGQTVSLEDKNRLDELYVTNISPWLDFRIMCETVRVLTWGGSKDTWTCDASLTGGVVAKAMDR